MYILQYLSIIMYISLEPFKKNIAHGWFHRYASTFEIQLMPTLSVVPLVLTLPNFLATQVASQYFSFFHLFQVAPRPHTYNGTNITLHVLQVGRARPKEIHFQFGLSFSKSVKYLDLSKSTKITSNTETAVLISTNPDE